MVDFDNIEPAHRAQGPVSLSRMLLGLLPANLLHPYDGATVRLYGGWRTSTGPTAAVQQLSPDIAANSPTHLNVTYLGQTKPIATTVSLAFGPIGTRKIFDETLVRNRPLRHFRSIVTPWRDCAANENCGLKTLQNAHNQMECSATSCYVRLGDILVRDEQKMVDTLIVADMAHEIFISKSDEIVIVSSDADIWPGIYLALQSKCRVTQLHTKKGWKTPGHLLRTLDNVLLQSYRELSI
jgi:hypothetical protein